MNTLSVSSYSVREHLGPVSFSFTDAEGVARSFTFDNEKLLDVAEFPERVRGAFGIDAIETVAFQFASPGDPELDRFEQNLRDSGVALLNVAIDTGDLLEADDVKRASDVAEIERWIDRFTTMGARFVRVNPGSPFSEHHGEEPPAHLVAALTELGEYAAARGARLLVENHGGPSSDPRWMNALLVAVGSEHLGLLLDLGNFDVLMQPAMALMFGTPDGAAIDPEQLFANVDLEPLYEGIEQLAARAELVHVKAHHVSDDGSVGPVDLERALGILTAHGYDGPLTVEYEGSGGDPWQKTARVLEVTGNAVQTEVIR